MTKTNLSLSGGDLILQCDFAYLQTCRAIIWPGRRWDSTRKVWIFPQATNSIVQDILKAFGGPLAVIMAPEVALMAGSDAAAPKRMPGLLPKLDHAADLARLSGLTRYPSRPIQIQGLGVMLENPAVMLAWWMSAGKTKAVIDFLLAIRAMTALVVCPANLVSVWTNEVRKHVLPRDDMPAFNVVEGGGDDGPGSTAAAAYQFEKQLALSRATNRPFLFVVNYERIWREPLEKLILKYRYDFIGADESHRIGDPKTKQAKMMRKLCDISDHRACLSGTPLRNSPLNIFGQYAFLNPQVFGEGFTMFRSMYAIMGGSGALSGKLVVGYKNMDDFTRRFHSLAHVVERDEVLGTPPAVTHRTFPLSPDEQKAYRRMARDFIVTIGEGSVDAPIAATKVLRFQQITAGFLPLANDDGELIGGKCTRIGTSKIDALKELAGDLPENEPLVIFVYFHAEIDAVHELAASLGKKSVEVSGRVDQIGPVWKANNGDWLVAQIRSGGIGKDFTRAAIAVMLTTGYSVTDYRQAVGRLDRTNQKRAVSIIHLEARGTVDEEIALALQTKGDLVDSVVLQRAMNSLRATLDGPTRPAPAMDGGALVPDPELSQALGDAARFAELERRLEAE